MPEHDNNAFAAAENIRGPKADGSLVESFDPRNAASLGAGLTGVRLHFRRMHGSPLYIRPLCSKLYESDNIASVQYTVLSVQYIVKKKGGDILESIQAIFAHNLKRTREERGLSLDQLAALCGVSKSMLAQIERGTTSPTITTIWKIANGLTVPFSELMTRPEADVEILHHKDITPLVEDDGHYRNYPLFNTSPERRFGMFLIELDPGAILRADPHPRRTQEFLTIFSGTLRVTVDGVPHTVKNGASMRFVADLPHSYENTGHSLCRVSMVIAYS